MDPKMDLSRAGARAAELFGPDGIYCAEAVVSALAEALGVESGLLPRMATGFCSGMGRTSGPCGAATGAVMGIGLAFGRNEGGPDSLEQVHFCYDRTQEFLERFTHACGGSTCLELTGCDMATPEGQATFKAGNGIVKCREYVEIAARIAGEVIAEGCSR